MSERFTPLPDANTNRVRTTLKLPYHLEDQIGLNLHSIETLCQIAGITDIKIFQNTDKVQPQIVGITSYGAAFAGASRTSVDRFSISNRIDDFIKGAPCGQWSHLEIGIREQEAVALLESQKKDIKDPKNWSALLDAGIKNGIISSGAETLIKRNPKNLIYSLVYAAYVANNIAAKDYKDLFTVLALLGAADKAVAIKVFGPERSGEGARWSLFLDGVPELDRMAVLLVATPVITLAKKI